MAEVQPSLPFLHLTQVSLPMSLPQQGHHLTLKLPVWCGTQMSAPSLWFQSSGFSLLTVHLETLSVQKFLLFWQSLKGCVSLTPQSFQEFCSGCLPPSCFAPMDSAFVEFGARIPKSDDTANEDAFCYWCSG